MASPDERILPKMQSTRDELLAYIEGVDHATLTRRSPEGGWSIRENLAHLADAERAHRRFAQAVLEGRSTRLEGFDLDRWNEERVERRAGQSPGQILADLRAERHETLAFIAGIPPEAWETKGDHPALGQISVRQVIKVIGVHERMHLKEMRRVFGGATPAG
jgi:uncharacterized protein (TIGR03083 family)